MSRAGRRRRPADATPLRTAWRHEIDRADAARANQSRDKEWRHLERAHILSQPFALLHTRTHARMLSHALRHRDRHETFGQTVRLLLAAPGSLTGRYPLGNTGGADVSAFRPMPTPEDLAPLLPGQAAVDQA